MAMMATMNPYEVTVEQIGDCSEPVALCGHNPWLLSFKSDAPFKGVIQIDNGIDDFEDLFIHHSVRADIDSEKGPKYCIVGSGVYRFKLLEGSAPVEMRCRERGMMAHVRKS